MDRPGPSRREVVSSIVTLTALAGAPRAAASAGELRFGLTPVFLTSISNSSTTSAPTWNRPLAFRSGCSQRRTYQEIAALLLAGQLDAAWICGFPYVRPRRTVLSLRGRAALAVGEPALPAPTSSATRAGRRRPRSTTSAAIPRLFGSGLATPASW